MLFAIIGIFLLLPLYIFIRLAYFLTGDFHWLFYSQTRIGKNGKPFKMFKFRTMVPNADEELKKLLDSNPSLKKQYEKNHKLDKDPRITKMGNLIRKLSFDEMPQFINVFLGQMSLVGNRPYLPYEKKDMGKHRAAILSTKPGITGFWQAHLRSRGTFEDRLNMDYFYSQNISFRLDVKILIKTFATLFCKSYVK